MKLLQIGLLNFTKYTNTPLPFYKGLDKSRGERCYMALGGIYNCIYPPTRQGCQEPFQGARQWMDLNLEHPLDLGW